MSKTVAIITMHRVLNYGSILQTLALSEFLREHGYTPKVVDYLFPNEYHKSIASVRTFPEPKQSRLRAHLNGLCQRVLRPNPSKKEAGFATILSRELSLTRTYSNETELKDQPVNADVYLTGSDQVWNPRWIGKDLAFHLSWVPQESQSLRVSYGSSFGQKSLDNEYIDYIAPFLRKYNSLSVREENEILPSLGRNNKIVLDPTFLLDKESWKKYVKPNPLVSGKYILCYLIGYSFDPFPYAYEVVKKVKKLTGYKVVMIAGEPLNMLKGYKLFNDCTTEEFLNLFYHASYVITSSFHGTAFAVNFGIPFTTIVDNLSDNDNRQASLVSQVGLGSEGILKKDEDLTDFSVMDRKSLPAPLLEKRRKLSQEYLLHALSESK